MMATVLNASEQKIILHNVRWETYASLLADHLDQSAPRFTYDRGELEIMSPSSQHEKYNRAISLFVEVLAEELNIDIENLGSTTFNREDLERGFEPDSCFYIQNEPLVAGKPRIDLSVDPPPDLVIEIDITSPSIDKLPIFAHLGVPEVWRCDGNRVSILHLENDAYRERDESPVLPRVTAALLTEFLEDSKTMKRTVWLRKLRAWARTV
ncbi:MAG: Uma2 family endonuclease [Acidobacteriota bacterium]